MSYSIEYNSEYAGHFGTVLTFNDNLHAVIYPHPLPEGQLIGAKIFLNTGVEENTVELNFHPGGEYPNEEERIWRTAQLAQIHALRIWPIMINKDRSN